MRPEASVSWRPTARIDREMDPRSAARGCSPNAVCAMSPHGRDGLTFDSITSATSVMASVCSPSIGSRSSGSQPSKIDSPRRRSLIRPWQ